ncbi:MAG TPA: deoxyribonuclease II family protein [Burkholderiales bacterium]|jgi:deoxyribonuclease-2|nr:deoxyribonuclease II family protein [Burkholderiales bacterium]
MKISAMDENGKPVDWWFMYKVPQLSAGANSDQARGYEYVYFDSTIDQKPGGKVVKSPFEIDKGQGALNRTLDAVFNKPDASTGWILYNDESPASANIHDNGNLGHTKGVIAFDTASKTAYWLLHSWPKFAEPAAKFDPTPKYGQTYLCLTLSMETVSKIAAQMINHQEPQTYLCHGAKNLPPKDPLALLMQPLKPAPTGDSNVIDLKTAAGMPFKVIAKNRAWNQDFWNGLVGPTLEADMDTETWIRGKIPPIADIDGIHKTFDIKYINLGSLGAHWAWPETHDHAKWGITLKSDWVCVGDINRMISQRKRGGGTIAFQNKILWQALTQSSLLLAPPGYSRTEAHKILDKAKIDPETQPKAKAATAAKKPAARKTAAKKATKPSRR